MPHAVTGQAGAVTVLGSALNGKLTKWTFTGEDELVDDRGAGELFMSRVGVSRDWTADVEGYVPDQAAMHVLNADEAEWTAAYSTSAVTLKFKSGDTNPYFTGTGLLKSFKVEAGIGGPSTFNFQIVCSEGTAPTIDSTPA